MATEGASRVVTAVFSDPDLRKTLVDADTPQARRQILTDAGLLEGFSAEDLESLRQLAGDQEALNNEILSSVSGGNQATEASDINGPGTVMVPSANAGGATVAADVIAGTSTAVTSTAMGVATIAVVAGGAIFGF